MNLERRIRRQKERNIEAQEEIVGVLKILGRGEVVVKVKVNRTVNTQATSAAVHIHESGHEKGVLIGRDIKMIEIATITKATSENI